MKILDKYILKKYLATLSLVLVLLIPIAIAIDISEKVDKFLRHDDLSVGQIISDYYVNFVIIYGNTFLPLALFIAVILFTSKLSNNTEIIAIHSAQISFRRFLHPYFIGGTLVALLALGMNHFVVPHSNKALEEFTEDFIRKRKKSKTTASDVTLQLSPNEIVHFKTVNLTGNKAYKFSYERFDGIQLKYKILADNIRWEEKDSVFRLRMYRKRWFRDGKEFIETGNKFDTIFNFTINELVRVDHLAKEMITPDLRRFIKRSEERGVKNLNVYLVELYKRTSLPIASYVLTFIAVILGAEKKRGGIGINLAKGIALMFIYVFCLKIVEVLGAGATSNPLFLVWLPNMLFGVLAVYLYFNAKN
ncbi:MAG: LptF/LptG family permease [Flavobacteriaceae bacterium]|nr:LptF/LptG family permease [Flavobacteriaceae bacterium]